MGHRLKRRGLIVGVQVGLLSWTTVECTSWRVQTVAPAAVITQQQPTKVRVSRAGQGKLVLDHPMIVGDSIVGRQGAMAVADATAVEVRKFDFLKTAGLVGGIWAGAAIICAATDCLEPDFGGITF